MGGVGMGQWGVGRIYAHTVTQIWFLSLLTTTYEV